MNDYLLLNEDIYNRMYVNMVINEDHQIDPYKLDMSMFLQMMASENPKKLIMYTKYRQENGRKYLLS